MLETFRESHLIVPLKIANTSTLQWSHFWGYTYICEVNKKGKCASLLLIVTKICKQFKYPGGGWLNTKYCAPSKRGNNDENGVSMY